MRDIGEVKMKASKPENELKRYLDSNTEVKDEILDKEIETNFEQKVSDFITTIQNQNCRLKEAFFWIVMVMYVFVILASIAAVVIVSIICKGWVEILSTTVASLAGILTSILRIPNIIAHYLFPKERELKELANMRKQEKIFEQRNKHMDNKQG